MLRGMGFDNTTSLYLASGEIYNANTNMAPLLEMFPLLQTKETLASEIELAPFKVREFIGAVFVVYVIYLGLTQMYCFLEILFQDGCYRLYCLSS